MSISADRKSIQENINDPIQVMENAQRMAKFAGWIGDKCPRWRLDKHLDDSCAFGEPNLLDGFMYSPGSDDQRLDSGQNLFIGTRSTARNRLVRSPFWMMRTEMPIGNDNRNIFTIETSSDLFPDSHPNALYSADGTNGVYFTLLVEYQGEKLYLAITRSLAQFRTQIFTQQHRSDWEIVQDNTEFQLDLRKLKKLACKLDSGFMSGILNQSRLLIKPRVEHGFAQIQAACDRRYDDLDLVDPREILDLIEK